MKDKLRKEILKKRNLLNKRDWLEKSIKIQKKLIESDFYKNAASVLVYYFFDREVMTDIIFEDALEQKKVICVPFNDWKTSTFTPSRISSVKEIDRSKRIPQPFKKNPFPVDKINLAVVPGVVFDIYGNRIGMGKGFFDKFFNSAGLSIFKVSLAFDFQVQEEKLPVDIWDRRIETIITETRVINTGG